MLLALEQGIQELKVLPCAQADEKRHTSDGGGLRRLLEAAGVTSDNLLGVVELCSKGAKLMGETARPSGLDAVGLVAAAAAATGASTVTNDQDAATGAAVKTDSATAAAAGWLRSS